MQGMTPWALHPRKSFAKLPDIVTFPTAYCLLPTAYCLLPTAYCLLPTAYFLSKAVKAQITH